MALSNPIILKELIQAARRRRTFLMRAALPVLAVALPLPEILRRIGTAGYDWRMISDTGRTFFESCAWLELSAFSLLAFLYSLAAVQDEWSCRTIEVLCASPLSAARIVYGKFAAVLSRVLLIALAMLPAMVIGFRVARIPPEMAFGSLAVIAGSVLFFGTVGLLQAILFGSGRRAGLVWFGILAPYLFIVSLLIAKTHGSNFLLVAMMPPVALSVVLRGGMMGIVRLGPGGFALLSLGVLTGLSLTGLALAPWLFRRAVSRHIGPVASKPWFPTFKRWLGGRRPKLKPAQNPFYWQEKGPATWFLRKAVWIVYLVILPFLATMRLFGSHNLEIAGGILTFAGLTTLFFASMIYGASIFARDKKWGRAQALLLTGRSPFAFIRAKIAATYAALWPSILVVGAVCLWSACNFFHRDTGAVIVFFLELALFGPLLGVVIGMAFSIAARSVTGAILGVIGAVIWGFAFLWILLGITPHNAPGFAFAAAFAGLAGVIFLTRLRRSIWALSALLAASFWAVLTCCLGVSEELHWKDFGTALMVGSIATTVFAALWFGLGLRNFEAGMMESAEK